MLSIQNKVCNGINFNFYIVAVEWIPTKGKRLYQFWEYIINIKYNILSSSIKE